MAMLLLSVLLSLLVSAPGLSSAAAPSPTSNGGSSTINAAPSSASWACPPPGFESVRGFSLQDYIARPWFVQQQSPNSYQRENQLFCVRAEYRLASNTSDRRLKVFNQARQGSVTGNLVNTGNSAFRLLDAVVRNKDRGQLAVGPGFIPDFLYGPYWVVAAGPSSPGEAGFTGYEWAIVSGGPPSRRGSAPGTCRNPTINGFWDRLVNPFGARGPSTRGDGAGNGEGLWLFTREQVVSAGTVAQLRSVAEGKGFDLSVLRPVPQAGCVFYDTWPGR